LVLWLWQIVRQGIYKGALATIARGQQLLSSLSRTNKALNRLFQPTLVSMRGPRDALANAMRQLASTLHIDPTFDTGVGSPSDWHASIASNMPGQLYYPAPIAAPMTTNCLGLLIRGTAFQLDTWHLAVLHLLHA